MDIPVKKVHIGKEIEKRLKDYGISKSEFGRRIGVRQQHVNRIFEMPSMDTEKLSDICVALDFNFFTFYVDFKQVIHAEKSALTWGNGHATVLIGDEALSAKVKELESEVKRLQSENATLAEQVKDKKEINDLLREKLSKYENPNNE